MEGHFDTLAPADLYVMGWVNKETQEVTGIKVPGGLSFMLHQDFDEPVTGLKAFEKQNRPTALNAIFQFYHIMVAIGMALIGLTLLACFYWWRGTLFQQRWLLWIFVFAVILPNIANQFGWYTAEMGRQPWVVYGLLRTSDALSRVVTANQVLFSLIMFTIIYTLLFALFIYLLNKKIKAGPYSDKYIQHHPIQQEMAGALEQNDKS